MSPRLNGAPDLSVEQLPPSLAALVTGANTFLMSLSSMRDFLSGAKDVQLSQGAVPPAEATAQVAMDRLERTEQATAEKKQSLEEAVGSGVSEVLTNDQRDMIEKAGEVLRGLTEERMVEPRPELPQAPAPRAEALQDRQALRDELRDVARTLDGEIGRLAGAIAGVDEPRQTSDAQAGALQAYVEQQARPQKNVMEVARDLVQQAIDVVDDLESIEIVGVNHIVGERNAEPRTSAKKVMGETASAARNETGSQWLHVLGRDLGGGDVKANFVAANGSQNYRMLPLEQAVAMARDAGQQVRVDVAASRSRLSKEGYSMIYRVHTGPTAEQPVASVTFDLRAEQPLGKEGHRAAKAALGQLKTALSQSLSPEQAMRELGRIAQAEQQIKDGKRLAELVAEEEAKREVERDSGKSSILETDDDK